MEQACRCRLEIRRWAAWVLSVILVAGSVLPVYAATHPAVEVIHKTAQPGVMRRHLLVIGEEVVAEEWTHTLELVNPPEARRAIYPGQCITVTALSSGDGRDALLRKATYSFTFTDGRHTRRFRGLHLAGLRHLKPEGADFVMQVLSAGHANASDEQKIRGSLSSVSMATFRAKWCAPANARDGSLTVQGSARLPGGKMRRFGRLRLPIFGYTSTIRRGRFHSQKQLSDWVMHYYEQPNPVRVLPACRFLAKSKLALQLNVRAFLVALLRSSPDAAHDLERRLPVETPGVQGYALSLLRDAGYEIGSTLDRLPEGRRAMIRAFLARMPPFPDIYDLRVNVKHFDTSERMDALWSTFLATGRMKPVRAVANLLAWRNDYQAVVAAHKHPREHKTLTPEIARGVCYMAAGWSLASFVHNYGLVADYTDAWKQDPKTPAVLKRELARLFVNPDFQQP